MSALEREIQGQVGKVEVLLGGNQRVSPSEHSTETRGSEETLHKGKMNTTTFPGIKPFPPPPPPPSLTPLLTELHNHFGSLSHSAHFCALSPDNLNPLITILRREIGRNSISRGGGTFIEGLDRKGREGFLGKLAERPTRSSNVVEDDENDGNRHGEEHDIGRAIHARMFADLMDIPGHGRRPTVSTGTDHLGVALNALTKSDIEAIELCVKGVFQAFGWDMGRRKVKGLIPILVNWLHTAREGKSSLNNDDEQSAVDTRISLQDISTAKENLQGNIKLFELDLITWFETHLGMPMSPISHPSSPSTEGNTQHVIRGRTAGESRFDVDRVRTGGASPLGAKASSVKLHEEHEGKVEMAGWLVAMLDVSSSPHLLIVVSATGLRD